MGLVLTFRSLLTEEFLQTIHFLNLFYVLAIQERDKIDRIMNKE